MNKERVELLFQYTKNAQDTKKVKIAWEEIEKELGIKIPTIKKSNDALVIFLMDTSGSMGVWEKHVAKEYYQYALEEIKKKFSNVEEIFITHGTESEYKNNLEQAVHGKASGGTVVSKGLIKARASVINNLDKHIYLFQFSDGDNLTSDCPRSNKLVEEILEDVEYFDYVELNQYTRHSALHASYKKIPKKENFRIQVFKHKDDSLKGVKFKEVLKGEINNGIE